MEETPLRIRDIRRAVEVEVRAKPTVRDPANLTFTYGTVRYLLKADGSLLRAYPYGNGKTGWEDAKLELQVVQK